MSSHRKVWKRASAWGIALLGCTFLVGCSPSIQQPLAGMTPVSFQKIAPNGWSAILASVQKGTQLKKYQIKSKVEVVDNSLHPYYATYGSIQKPDKVSMSVHEGDFNIDFFQQGKSAFSFINGHWSVATPLSNPDVFPTYLQILEGVAKTGAPVYLEPTQYIVDEYCTVYAVKVPAAAVEQLAEWDGGEVFSSSSPVLMTLMIGKRNDELREVQTTSVGSLPNIGPIELTSTTVLFNMNKKYADVTVPASLVKQMKD